MQYTVLLTALKTQERPHLEVVCTQLPATAGTSCCNPSRPDTLTCTACRGCCGACWPSEPLTGAGVLAVSVEDLMEAVLPAPAKLIRFAAVLSERASGAGTGTGATPSQGLEHSLIEILHVQSNQDLSGIALGSAHICTMD